MGAPIEPGKEFLRKEYLICLVVVVSDKPYYHVHDAYFQKKCEIGAKAHNNGITKGQVLSLNWIIHFSHYIPFARSERVLRLCYPRRDGADNILLFFVPHINLL